MNSACLTPDFSQRVGTFGTSLNHEVWRQIVELSEHGVFVLVVSPACHQDNNHCVALRSSTMGRPPLRQRDLYSVVWLAMTFGLSEDLNW